MQTVCYEDMYGNRLGAGERPEWDINFLKVLRSWHPNGWYGQRYYDLADLPEHLEHMASVGSLVAYSLEMSFRHPILYFLFYRWWVRLGCPPKYRPLLIGEYYYQRTYRYRTYWTEFSLYHPVQYMLLLFVVTVFKFLIKCLTAPIKAVYSWLRDKGLDGTPADIHGSSGGNGAAELEIDSGHVEELAHQDADVPPN